MFMVCRICVDDLKKLASTGHREHLNVSPRGPIINCSQQPRCFDQPERVKQGDNK